MQIRTTFAFGGRVSAPLLTFRERARVIGLLVLLLTGLAILWIAGVLFAVRLLTHPVRRTYAGAVARGRPGDPSELAGSSRKFESWTFQSRGKELPVWDIVGDNPIGPVIIATHGWGDSRIGALIRLGPLLPIASRILLWDMPGHGDAPGTCRLGTDEVDDLLALIGRVHPTRLVLYGWSLGAGVSIAAATRIATPVMLVGIIAESPYALAQTPAMRVAGARGLPAGPLIAPAFSILGLVIGGAIRPRIFDRRLLAAKMRAPCLVVHGDLDEISPIQDGREIATACAGELLEIRGAHHNDLWSDPAFSVQCAAGISSFLNSIAK